ncbi:hypothetical protein D9619_000261 [Psilocybe cf. subviscida]|uniref:Uncharacterized protein n=1 Tax=Psilocybe cf. subviscida TaxID=2480587 RepID=A0A8H5F269_9AGAR|nr:hypothetical protein D9619_000261 [Psilocybe cf. subviscida]
MADGMDQYFDFSAFPLLKDLIAPSPADSSFDQEPHGTPLPLQDCGVSAHTLEPQHASQTRMDSMIQHQAAVTPPLEAVDNHGQLPLSPFASNLGGQQPTPVSSSGGSFLPVGGSVGGMARWNQYDSVAEAGVASSNPFYPQVTPEYNARSHAIQYPQEATVRASSQLPPNHPSFAYRPNPLHQQAAPNATHNQPFNDQQNSGLPSPYHSGPTAQLPTFNSSHQQAHVYQQSSGLFFPSYSSYTAAHQTMFNGHQRIEYPQVMGILSPVYQPQGNVVDQVTMDNHNNAANPQPEQMERFRTESPLTDAPLTPPVYNAPSNRLVAAPGEVKERNHEAVSPAMQTPVPLYPRGVFYPMVQSPAPPSPVDPWAGAQAVPVNVHPNSPQYAEIPAPRAGFRGFKHAIPPSEGRSTISFASDSSIHFKFYTGPK